MTIGLHRLTQQGLGKRLHKCGLADTFRSIKQNRVRQAGPQLLQLLPTILQPGEYGLSHAETIKLMMALQKCQQYRHSLAVAPVPAVYLAESR